MPALNFLAIHAPKVKNRTKRCSIRKKRKRPIKVGDKLYFFTGQRTKHCKKLGEGICKAVHEVNILADVNNLLLVFLDGLLLDQEELETLAIKDGFEYGYEFLKFFYEKYKFPFNGNLIEW